MTSPSDKVKRAIPADRIERLLQLVGKACRDAAVNEDERSYELWTAVRRELQDAPEVTAPSAERAQVAGKDGLWMVYYEDAEVKPEVFFGPGAEQAARGRFEVAEDNWSCHLLARICTPVYGSCRLTSEHKGQHDASAPSSARPSNALAEKVAHILALAKKALPGPWSHKILRDYRLSPHDNDTPYVYGPNDTKVMCGLWPIHGPKPEDTAAAERQTFATIELVAALRNLLHEHGGELAQAVASATRATNGGTCAKCQRTFTSEDYCPICSNPSEGLWQMLRKDERGT